MLAPGVRLISAALLLALVAFVVPRTANAAGFESLVAKLANPSEVAAGVDALAASGDPRALAVLEALSDDELVLDERGQPYVSDAGKLTPVTKDAGPARGKPKRPVLDNRLRRALLPALGRLRLASPHADVRRLAAEEIAKRADPDARALVAKALARESDSSVRDQLELGLARIDLASGDRPRQLGAVAVLGRLGDMAHEADLQSLLGKRDDTELANAASSALAAIKTRASIHGAIGNVFYGISLGSVLLLAALGLAITFGLMRVINMAHGEMLMLGAYATYVVQNTFQQSAPELFDWYILAALPAAFAVCFVIGVALERTVVRYLYGRPLETLLATWGISLILIQIVRLSFGAANVTVANPSFLSGGYHLFPGVVLPYSRIAVILFVVFVVAFVAFVLQKTPVGLQVRAIQQNREMAAAMGIKTRRVDTWTFGLGSGVAGLGGVALSQLGNVGPELGQGYIVDSFMVVVLGGVGKLAGTVVAAVGLGTVNKLLEPLSGAVLGKIIVLVFIVLFIQRRPQGLFAPKGRAAEA
jgi:urea transport system permease protein